MLPALVGLPQPFPLLSFSLPPSILLVVVTILAFFFLRLCIASLPVYMYSLVYRYICMRFRDHVAYTSMYVDTFVMPHGIERSGNPYTVRPLPTMEFTITEEAEEKLDCIEERMIYN